jgi:ketosteroid isomerase-like protein
MLRREVLFGWSAFSRRDLEHMLVRYAPDVKFEFAPGQQTLGLDGTFRGHAGMVAGIRQLEEAWDSIELDPAATVDLGERVVNLGFVRWHARSSGVELNAENAQLITVRDGLVSEHRAWFSWEEGLRAAGLDPDAIALPNRERRGDY